MLSVTALNGHVLSVVLLNLKDNFGWSPQLFDEWIIGHLVVNG